MVDQSDTFINNTNLSDDLYKQATRDPLITHFLETNKQINLSAIRNYEEVWEKHILDTLSLIQSIQTIWPWHPLNTAKTWLDVGTWGWFPLMPLAKALPHMKWTGLDARRKKTEAVGHIAAKCNITNVQLTWWRIEDHTHHYDIITARAVGIADRLIPLLYQRLNPWWQIVLYKMVTTDEEKRIKDLITTPYWRKRLSLYTTYYYTLQATPRALYFLKDIALQKR
jgi:16S rRNA (guanine527-N7)-methyltransferase